MAPAETGVTAYIPFEKYVAGFSRVPVFEREFSFFYCVAAPGDVFLDALAALIRERGVVYLA